MPLPRDRSPLDWPVSQPRTEHRKLARFKLSLGQALDYLRGELSRLGAQEAQITCNLPVGSRGTFLIDEGKLKEPGIAVYFKLRGQTLQIGCDHWQHLADNANALAHTIEAIRGIARWGSTQMMEKAFSGFQALPAPASDWRTVLQLQGQVTIQEVKRRHRELALSAHPDTETGDHDAMVRLNSALEAAERELGGAS